MELVNPPDGLQQSTVVALLLLQLGALIFFELVHHNPLEEALLQLTQLLLLPLLLGDINPAWVLGNYSDKDAARSGPLHQQDSGACLEVASGMLLT